MPSITPRWRADPISMAGITDGSASKLAHDLLVDPRTRNPDLQALEIFRPMNLVFLKDEDRICAAHQAEDLEAIRLQIGLHELDDSFGNTGLSSFRQ